MVVVMAGCYYDVEEELYGLNCNTGNVTYSSTITGILNNYGCLGCHAGGNPSGGVNLDNYGSVRARVTDGRLFGAISHATGFKPMPDGAPKMSPCDISKVKAWIDAGAPDN